MKNVFVTIIILLLASYSGAQTIERVEPPCWWVGMKNQQLQLMVYGDKIAEAEVSIAYPGATLTSSHRVENPNYLFLNLEVHDDAVPGAFDIIFELPKAKNLTYSYKLNSRRTSVI